MKVIGPLLVGMACVLPLRLLDRCAWATSWLWWTLLPVRRGVALDNLARAEGVPHGRARGPLLRRHLHELALGYLELVRWRRLGEHSDVRVDFVGIEHLQPGAVVVVGHLGAWDLGILAVARALAAREEPVPVGIHVRAPRDAWSRAFIADLRTWAGLRTLDPAAGMAGARSVLAAGGVMAFVHDQAHLRGRRLPFLGRTAATSTGFARASLASQHAACAWISRVGVGHHVVTIERLVGTDDSTPSTEGSHDESIVIARTLRASAWLEGRVRAEPHAWLWMHRRWKER